MAFRGAGSALIRTDLHRITLNRLQVRSPEVGLVIHDIPREPLAIDGHNYYHIFRDRSDIDCEDLEVFVVGLLSHMVSRMEEYPERPITDAGVFKVKSFVEAHTYDVHVTVTFSFEERLWKPEPIRFDPYNRLPYY